MNDVADLFEIERRLTATTAELQRYTDAVSLSRQIKEFSSDLRKNLLARYVAPFLRAGESATAAETLARADVEYRLELIELQSSYTKAEKHIAKWDALHCQFEAQRSALSLAKTQIQLT